MNNLANVKLPFQPLNTMAGGEAGQVVGIPLIRQYIRIAVRWRYVIAGAVGVCVLLGLAATLLMTPKYTASTLVEISRESTKITDIQGVERDASVGDQEFYQTQYGLLQSRTLSERVAQDLKLVDDPQFFARAKFKSNDPAFALVNGRFPVSGRDKRLKIVGDMLLHSVAINPTRLSRLVQISFTSPDPAFSARVADAWADDFIQITLERRYQATSYARKFLETRLEQLRTKLQESERQLVAYASQEGIVSLPGATTANGERMPDRSIDADDLIALNASLAQATADRVQAEARYDQLRSGSASSEALTNPAVNILRQKRAELAAEYQRMMVQFQPDYPAAKAIAAQLAQLDKGIAREENRVTGSLGSDYRAALERETQLKSRVERSKGNILDLRRRSIQYNIFQREVDTNRQLYDGLLQRYKEIGVAGGVGVNNVSIVDTADVPTRPSSPRMMLNLAISLLAGIVLGCLGAFALEQIDEAIADPEELERELGIPLLGAVPKTAGNDPIEALADRKSELVEAYLSVQTNLQFTTEHGVPRSMAVTSTRPAEGKSTTAVALAMLLARSNKRVVLIDGDMRSPSVHHLAGVRNERGLSNFLAGEDDLKPLLYPVDTFGITVMASGPLPPNAAELLTGDRFKKLLSDLGRSFDHIVVDSPPVMGLADAPLISSCVESVVYVVESHGIRTSLVRTAIARLGSASAHIVGGVLTKFEAKRAHYGYGYEYGYGYGRDARGRAKADAAR